MIYNILTLVRYDAKKPLWTPLMVEKKIPDSDVTIYEEFSTENVEELKIKIQELLETISMSEIKVINDVDYSILITISNSDIQQIL